MDAVPAIVSSQHTKRCQRERGGYVSNAAIEREDGEVVRAREDGRTSSRSQELYPPPRATVRSRMSRLRNFPVIAGIDPTGICELKAAENEDDCDGEMDRNVSKSFGWSEMSVRSR